MISPIRKGAKDADEFHDKPDENEEAGDKDYKLPMLSDYRADCGQISPPSLRYFIVSGL